MWKRLDGVVANVLKEVAKAQRNAGNVVGTPPASEEGHQERQTLLGPSGTGRGKWAQARLPLAARGCRGAGGRHPPAQLTALVASAASI